MARDWLKLASDAYASSTTYVDSNYRKKWDDALRMFQSRHPQDSKYNTDAYKHRSKIFRPKTRSLVRKHEAATASAFFSNVDVISTSPADQDNPQQAASADVMKELLQYRLTKSIPWFQIVCGGMQDAMTVGVVCSYQYWKYKAIDKESTYEPVMDEMGQPVLDEFGQIQLQTIKQKEVIEDKPCVELIPVENIRFDPGADWTNPAMSSPYLIRMIPMYVCDIRALMDDGDEETGKKWKSYTDAQIKSAMKNQNDQTRQTRDQLRQDPLDASNAPIGEYEIAWVHENFMRIDGSEMVYFTLGVEFMLTDPVPIKDIYFHGERPIIIGKCVIETHKSMPESPVLMADQLQREANEIVNQRLDNVKLVLNKRYIVKRGAQVDLKSIVRNVPASITLANDPVNDVRALEFNDVTSSSYQEQDRLNVDYDELTGNFSQGSIMTNRKMGETVGGMGMISQAANQITEYTIRTLTETWIEPVLRQLVKLEQKYETDQVILSLAAGKAKLFEKYGVSQINDELLNQELTLTVNVGMGATDPMQRLNKFIGALSAYAQVAAMQIPDIELAEVGKEIFGLAGYRDGARFSKQSDANQAAQAQIQQVIQQANQAVQESQQAVAQKEQELNQKAQEMALTEKDIENALSDIAAAKKELGLMEQLAMQKIDEATMRGELDAQARESKINELAANKLEAIAKTESAILQNLLSKAEQTQEKREPEKTEPSITSITIEKDGVMRKTITIKAPSGGVYTGTVNSEAEI